MLYVIRCCSSVDENIPSADLTAGTECEQLPFELPCGRILSVLIKNDSEAAGINTLLVQPQQRGTLNLINQEIIAPKQGVVTSEAIRVMRRETATRSALGGRKRFRRFERDDSAGVRAE